MLKLFGIFNRSSQSRDLYVYHHLNLNAMIQCNGMIRHLLEDLDSTRDISVLCRDCYVDVIDWMYRDEPRIRIVSIDASKDEQREVRRVCRDERVRDLLTVGHDQLLTNGEENSGLTETQLCYEQLSIPYENRFTKCYWERDFAEESRLFEKLAPDGDYIFVHAHPKRESTIDRDASELPIVVCDMTENIFHHGLLLERAKEVHCVPGPIHSITESLDMCMADVDVVVRTRPSLDDDLLLDRPKIRETNEQHVAFLSRTTRRRTPAVSAG